jgi:S1-C subfamily serine protease
MPVTMTILKIIITAIAIFVLKGSAFGELSVSQIVNKYSPSVVTIISLDENDQPLSRGSGFFINASGDIATSHHLFAGAFKASVKTLEGKEGKIIAVGYDETEINIGKSFYLP